MKYFFYNIKKFIYENEYIRIFVLLCLATYAYYPYLSGVNMGSNPGDGQSYQYILHDALIQLKNGIFPVYVGQSQFNFFGGSDIRAPYYLLFAQFIYLLTFGKLNALYIQHLTVFFSALLASFLSYFLFTRLAPKLRWASVVLAFFYISCPGIMSLMYHLDMYHSFMVIPYIPLLLYSLIRGYQKNDNLSSAISAFALSLIWMCHPPVALWASAVCIGFYVLQIVVFRRGLKNLFVMSFLFVVFNLWQFTSIFSLGLGSGYVVSLEESQYVESVIGILKADIPGVFLPLSWGSGTSFIQLGYALWGLILLGLVATVRTRFNFLIVSLLTCIIFLMLFLYPIPIVGHLLWSLTPKFVKNITFIWPMQRIYIVLAALACFTGLLALNELNFLPRHSLTRRLINITLFSLLCWSISQSYYLVKIGKQNRDLGHNSWVNPEYIYFHHAYLPEVHQNLFEGTYDPALKNKIVDQNQNPINSLDNELAVLSECVKNKISNSISLPISIDESKFNIIQKLGTIKGLHNQPNLLCLVVSSEKVKNALSRIEIFDSTRNYVPSVTVRELDKPTKKILVIPIFNTKLNQELTVFFNRLLLKEKSHQYQPMIINHIGLIKYSSDKLPIRIKSFTPYTATVTTKTDNNYLQPFKAYFPGYEATVNGKRVLVQESKDNMLMVPLKNKGFNEIEINYVGTLPMRISFIISCFAYCAFISYLIILIFSRKDIQVIKKRSIEVTAHPVDAHTF